MGEHVISLQDLRAGVARLEALATQLLESDQYLRERVVALEAEVRELKAHVRRQDRS